MKIKLLKAAIVDGSYWPAGSTVDASAAAAADLLNAGLAEPVKDTHETATTQ